MNKAEYKKLYSEYREANHSFSEYMDSSNFPCGHDDMLYERHADAMDKWLQDKPELKAILNLNDETDPLEWRSSDLSWYEPKMRAKYLLTSYKRSA